MRTILSQLAALLLALLGLLCGGVHGDPNAQVSTRPTLVLEHGDTLCLMGGALAERMQDHGWLELRLQTRFKRLQLSVRNLGFGGDELAVHQRTMNFGKFSADGMQSNLRNERFVPWDRYLEHCQANVVFAFFGFNESFAGEAGLSSFRSNLETFIDHVQAQRYDGKAAPELVLFSSIPFEDQGSANLPSGVKINARIELYNGAMGEVAAARGVRFVDIYTPMLARYARETQALTINGIHLKDAGDEELAEVIDEALFGLNPGAIESIRHTTHAAIKKKNRLWFNRYRATDGYNVYGGRSRKVYLGAADGIPYSNFDVLERELDYIDGLVADADRSIWALVNGREFRPDRTKFLPLLPVATNKEGDGEHGTHIYERPAASIEEITAAPGLRVNLFADERQFPELVNPVQMAWDTRGRLWVATWPTYPHWKPDLPMNDKLLILEDTDGDGRADKRTVFADNLRNPTGLEFWNGGVLLGAAPDLLFLKDTDGDDRVDTTEQLLHGLSSADTHHSANSFVLGPGGALYFQEGTFHQSQIESINGPVRNTDACVWRFNPRTWSVERYIPYNFANPHGHVFDRWGQDFMTDGTGNVNYYSLPFSGYLPAPKKHSSYFSFFPQRSRPAGGTEILSSAHFPDNYQGNYLIANVIGFRGIFNYSMRDDRSGFAADELEPIVQSSDLNFRPVDIEMGPDGALYFLDWHNALIGHLQHHLRDPSRDNKHGRVYRVSYEDRPLLTPAPIAGRPIEELVALLAAPEDRTRYRVRIELSSRDSESVTQAALAWVQGLDKSSDEYEHQRLEALWLFQQHNRMDRELLLGVLSSPDARARAAATRVLRYSRHLVPDALDLLGERALDENPRVRLEAVVAASFFHGTAAASVALEALRQPTDKFLDYALVETMRALEDDWKSALKSGEALASDNPAGIKFLLTRVNAEELVNLPRMPSVLKALLTRKGVASDVRLTAAGDLASLRGSTAAEEVLAAMRAVDDGVDSGAAGVLHQLSQLLGNLSRAGVGPPRVELLALAEDGSKVTTRALGYAALVDLDGSVHSAWVSASKSGAGLLGLLKSMELIQDESLRTDLGALIRPMLFDPPAQYATASAGTGLEVAFYEPCPKDARRESLASLTPAQELWAGRFGLDLAPARESDSFGLLFQGTLFVPEDGHYVFQTSSDDGSRLYIDERCVVDNDGPHGMLTGSGEIDLKSGAHPIAVTYFEQGGGDGLIVQWSGPGIELQQIPPSVLGSGIGTRLRAAAVDAMAFVPGDGQHKLADATRLLEEGTFWGGAVELLRSAPSSDLTAALLEPSLRALTERLQGLTVKERMSDKVAAAIEVGRRLADALEGEPRNLWQVRLDELGGTLVRIATLPHQMLYDLGEFWVVAGKPVRIIFDNNDMMPHNFVITLPGAMEQVGKAAELLTEQASGAPDQFVPATDAVLWHTRLVLPGESVQLTFVAPEQAADHPYVCTYPGHWRVMNGIMHVVPGGSELPALKRRASEPSDLPPRTFVKDWAIADLKSSFSPGWEERASVSAGDDMFVAAGCVSCHSIGCENPASGPDLLEIAKKYEQPLELLQHVLEPSLAVLEGYNFYIFELQDQPDVIGRVIEDDGTYLHVLQKLLDPDSVVLIPKDQIVERFDTGLSPMPTGLLVTLTESDILDLVSFLRSPELGNSDTHTEGQAAAEEQPFVTYEGKQGPGAGKHIVLIAGDEEYRSEEALPMLARILAERHGFRCTVLFSTDKQTGEINPEEQTNIPGIELLDEADMMVCFLRFRELPDADMKHFVDFVNAGKPILGLRTATHSFDYRRDKQSPYARYTWNNDVWPGGFGRQILGETWIAHHGQHGKQSTRGVLESANASHPVLRGVSDVWGPTDVYAVSNLPEDASVLLWGQVLEGMQPDSAALKGPQNEPMMPIVWAREIEQPDGSLQRIICSTIGASVDCQSEDLRRLFINACYWGMGLEDKITAEGSAELVGEYKPTPFGFGGYTHGVRAADFR